MSYSTVNDDYFNVDMNDDRFSVEDETEQLGQNSIKLIISQLRLTCVELKVALKLQGTNFLLHIDQLKNRHEALQTEVKQLKMLICEKNVLDISQKSGFASLDLSRENINNESNAGDFEDFDINFSSNVSESPNQHMKVHPKIGIDIMKKDSVKILQQNNPHVENNSNESGALNDSRLIKNTVLCNNIVSEDIENYADHNNEKSADASKCMNHDDDEEKSCNTPPLSEALPQECAVQLSKLSNSFGESQHMENILTQNVITSSVKSDVSISEGDNSAQNVQTAQNTLANCIKSRKINNFSNIKTLISNKLVDSLGERVMIKKMLRISENNRNSIMNEEMVETSRIIQICLYDDGNYSIRILNKNEVPKIQTMNNERFYKVDFRRKVKAKKVKGGKKFVEFFNNLKNFNSSILDNIPSNHNSIVEDFSNDTIGDVEFEKPANHTITTTADIHLDQGISKLKRKSNGNVNVQCKNRKEVLINDDSIVNSSCVSSTSISDNEIVKKSSKSNDDEIQVDNINNVSISKPIILSNQIIEGDFYIKKLLVDKYIQDSIITKEICLPVTEKSGDNLKNTSMIDKISKHASLNCNEIPITEKSRDDQKNTSIIDKISKHAPLNCNEIPITEKSRDNLKNTSMIDKISKHASLKCNEIPVNHNTQKNQLKISKNSNLTSSEIINNSIGRKSETITYHNRIKYPNNSTQQSFESLMNQSSFDITNEDSQDDQQINKFVSKISARRSLGKKMCQKNPPKRNKIYVRTEKRQLTTLPSVTLREYRTWNIDDDDEEIIIQNDNYDDEVCIVEVANTPIVID